MNTQDSLPLAPRDLLVLAALADGPLHGYGIIKAVELRSESGVHLDPANLYRVLRRMRQNGWIRETAGATDVAPGADVAAGEGDGHPSRRRTYEITASGKALLGAELKRLERLLRQVGPAVTQWDGS